MMTSRLLIAIAILLTALFLQIAFGDVLNIWTGLVLAALIAGVFFLSIPELICVILAAVLILNWQPAWSSEIFVFSVIPITAYFVKTIIPFQPFLSNLLLIGAAVVFFYALFDPGVILHRFGLLALDAGASMIYGGAAFWILKMQS
ncbi:MAG: hypothetical protein HY434_01505 [Candidatus Liptonbacteria bacterium]|nr:hypothetical protein [Candidatus Liptonbacteria bacterium]